METHVLRGHNLSVPDALNRIGDQCSAAKGSEALCRHLYNRLRYLYTAMAGMTEGAMKLQRDRALPEFARLLGEVLDDLKLQTDQVLLYRLATSLKFVYAVLRAHRRADDLYEKLSLDGDTSIEDARALWISDRAEQERWFVETIGDTTERDLAMEVGDRAKLDEILALLDAEVEARKLGPNNNEQLLQLMEVTRIKDLPESSNVHELLTEYLNEVEKFRNVLHKYRGSNPFRRLWSHRKIMANIRGVTDKITSFEGRIHIMVVVKVDQALGEVKIGNATADETLQEVKFGNSTGNQTLQEVKDGNATANQMLAVVSDLAQLVEAGVADILQAQERTASDTRALRNEARQGKLAESTTMIRYELDNKRQELPARHIANLERVYSGIEDIAHPTKPTFSKWFISPNDIDYDVKTPFALGGFGQVYHGTWTGGAEVVIKVLLADDETARRLFKQELDVWYSLDHPHINHLYGACDSVSPPFFVSEEAKNGDFVSYFREVGRAEVWRLFYEAALGLDYLHSKKVIHGDLKCSNLLVGTDNRAKICDFGFSYVRTASVGMSAKAQAEAIRFKAPETMLQSDNPDDYNPRRASDVYSFGLCIWEAFEGEAPFGTMDDDEITEKLFDSDFEFPAPQNLPLEQWEFVKRMLCHNWKQRVSLYVVIDKLCEYKNVEAGLATTGVKSATAATMGHVCTCNKTMPDNYKFCGDCGGAKFSAAEYVTTA